MRRSRLPRSAGLLLVFALFVMPARSEAETGGISGMGLHPGQSAIVPAATPEALSEAPPADGLRLKLARALRSASEPAGDVPLLPPTLPRILTAILLFLATNTMLLLLFSIVMRMRRELGQRRRDRFRERWEPLLHARMSGDAAPLPPLAPAERLLFLGLWLHLLGYVRDESAAALVQTARDLGLEQYALHLLESASAWKRLVAMRSVEALRLAQAGDALFAKAMQKRPRSSLTAARALLQIDPERGFDALGHLLKDQEWSPAAMVEIVRAGGSMTVQKLAALVHSAAPGRAKQVVRLIELLEDQNALPALRERLASSDGDEEIAAILHCLGRLGQGEDRATALAFLEHHSWLVRMQAAYMLGTLGLVQDIARLAPLLRDRHWWVRYRAAQSLLRLAGTAALNSMRDKESDPYTSEMLARVLAEGR